MKQCDVFYITYDEPQADSSWERLRGRIPWAKRIHGIKGFDAAYKACASASGTPRFFTVDGDNELAPAATELALDFSGYPENAVLSWSARNSINGLSYGNGGIKNWPRDVVSEMQTHEASCSEGGAVDFCFQLPYHQMPETLSTTQIHLTPYQAFRAGFREGVKMCLEKGRRPHFTAAENAADTLRRHLWRDNLDRLRIWCSVGADVENGPWSIYGARLACQMLCLTDWSHHSIRDYDWFRVFWEERQWPLFRLSDSAWDAGKMNDALACLESPLNERLGLGVTALCPEASRFFKSVYLNPPRNGPMFK